MQPLLPLLWMLLLHAPQETESGVVAYRITTPKGPTTDGVGIRVYDLTNELEVAQMLERDTSFAPKGPPRSALVQPKELKKSGELWHVVLPPGTYCFRVSIPGSPPYWHLNQPVSAGKTVELAVAFGPTGSLRASWTLDKGARKGLTQEFQGLSSSPATVSLVREGIVHHSLRAKRGEEFHFPRVRPGVYGLVIRSAHDKFTWVERKVKIKPGKSRVLKVRVLRSSIGGVMFQVWIKGKKSAAAQYHRETFFLMEEHRYFAIRSNTTWSVKSRKINARGFVSVPIQPRYVLLAHMKGFQPVRKEGIVVRTVRLAKRRFVDRTWLEKDYRLENIRLIEE